MTSEHIKEVIEFMKRERTRVKTKEEIIKKFQEIGFLDENGDYTAPYRNLGRWIDECNRRGKATHVALK
jgi:Ca2+-binding EF-hand superfamily protein